MPLQLANNVTEDPEHALLNPRVFVAYTIEEHHPLSADGYAQMAAALRAWSSFRQKRVDTINRFAVEDHRTAEEIELDGKIQAKLKAAYKAAKAVKRKNRELAREAAKAEKAAAEARAKEMAQASGRSGLSGQSDGQESEAGSVHTESSMNKLNIGSLGKTADKTDQLAAIREGEGDDEDMESDEEEDENYVDPLEVEISAAFETFCKFGDDFVPRISTNHLRAAFVQLFNCKISQDWIDQVILSEDIDPTLTALDAEEFERLYFRAMNMMEEVRRAEAVTEAQAAAAAAAEDAGSRGGGAAATPNPTEMDALNADLKSKLELLENRDREKDLDAENGNTRTTLTPRESDRLEMMLDMPANSGRRISGRRDINGGAGGTTVEELVSPLSLGSPKFAMKPLSLGGGNAAGGGINAIRSYKQ